MENKEIGKRFSCVVHEGKNGEPVARYPADGRIVLFGGTPTDLRIGERAECEVTREAKTYSPQNYVPLKPIDSYGRTSPLIQKPDFELKLALSIAGAGYGFHLPSSLNSVLAPFHRRKARILIYFDEASK